MNTSCSMVASPENSVMTGGVMLVIRNGWPSVALIANRPSGAFSGSIVIGSMVT